MSAPHEQGALGPESVTTTQTTADRLNWLQGLAQSELRKSLDRRKHLPPQILTAGIANEISAEIRAAIDCHRPGQYSSWVRGNHLGDMQVTVGVPSWPDEPASAPASGAERMTAGEVWFRLPPEQKPIKGFPNRAGQTDTDDAIAAELEGAGIEVYRLELLRKTSGEVKTAVRGGLHGWSFTRAWRYWIAEGPGIELAAADILHAAHPSTVRVNGHCGCPSPREQNLGLAIGSYHVDSQAGLKGLADTIKALVERPATPAPATPPGVPDSVRALSEAASPGPWYAESEKCDGSYGSGDEGHEGYLAYSILTDAERPHGNPGVIAETSNSTLGVIHEEWNEDDFTAWDETARANTALIVYAVNRLRDEIATHPAGQSAGSGAGWTTPHQSPVSPQTEAAARRIAARRADAAEASLATANAELARLRAEVADLRAERDETQAHLAPFSVMAGDIAHHYPGHDHDDFFFRMSAFDVSLKPFRAARAFRLRTALARAAAAGESPSNG